MKDFKLEDIYSLIVGKIENWITDLIALLPNMVVAIILLVLFFFLARTIHKLAFRSLTKFFKNISLNHLISNVLYAIVLFIGVFVALDILKLEKTVTSLLAGIGVIGLALSFAFQDLAANFISGILLTMRTPIKSGDLVEVAGVKGTVIKINLRSTEIETFQGALVIVPNKNVFQNPLYNYSHFHKRRIDIEAGVSFQEDLTRVKELTIKVVKALPIIDTKQEVLFQYDSFGESRIKFTVKAWLSQADQVQYKEGISQIIIAMRTAYDKNGIKIPFPIRTVEFNGMKKDDLKEVVDSE